MNLSLIIACAAVGLCIGLLFSLCKLSDKIIDIQCDLDEAKSDINTLDATINGNAYRHRRTSYYTTYGTSLITRVHRLEYRLDVLAADEVKKSRIEQLDQVYNSDHRLTGEELYNIAHGISSYEEETKEE